MSTCLDCSRYIGCLHESKSVSFRCPNFSSLADAEQGTLSSLLAKVLVAENSTASRAERNKHRRANEVITLEPRSSAAEAEKRADAEIARIMSGVAEAERVVDEVIQRSGNHSYREYQEALREIAAAGVAYAAQLQSIVADATSGVDFLLDDSDHPKARNFFEFCTSPTFMGESPYTVQLLVAILVLEDYCPHCSNTEYFDTALPNDTWTDLENNICLLEHGRCPECNRTKHDFLVSGHHTFYTDLAMMVGQRAGKSYTTQLIILYLVHFYIKSQNPHGILGISRATPLVATVCSLKLNQAKTSLYGPMLAHVQRSPWFRNYVQWLQDNRPKNGRELVALNETSMQFRHRGLVIQLDAADGGTLRGASRIVTAVDEIAHVPDDDQTATTSAKQIYVALSNSLLTAYGTVRARLLAGKAYDVYAPIQCNISSCCHKRDPLMQLIQLAKTQPTICVFIKATWDVNPTLPRSTFDVHFSRDPVEANRNYGSIPPATNSPFFPQLGMVRSSLKSKDQEPYEAINLNKYLTRSVKSFAGQPYTCAEMRSLTDLPKPTSRTVIALDAGRVNNCYALTIHDVDPITFKDRLFAALEVQPFSPTEPINFHLMCNSVLIPLARWANALIIGADRWQSMQSLDSVVTTLSCDNDNPQDVYKRIYSLTYKDLMEVRAKMTNGETRLPLCPGPNSVVLDFDHVLNMVQDDADYPRMFEGKPIEHFYFQVATVRDIAGKCLKGDRLTDDVFRAYCLGAYMLQSEDLRSELVFTEERKAATAPLAVVLSNKSRTGAVAQPKNGLPALTFSLGKRR